MRRAKNKGVESGRIGLDDIFGTSTIEQQQGSGKHIEETKQQRHTTMELKVCWDGYNVTNKSFDKVRNRRLLDKYPERINTLTVWA